MPQIFAESKSCLTRRGLKLMGTGFFLIMLLGSFFAPNAIQAKSPNLYSNPSRPTSIMPPHPSLAEKVRLGLIKMPRMQSDSAEARKMGVDQNSPAPSRISGVVKTLAVLVDFSDKPHTTTGSYFDNLIYARPAPGVTSVTSYYDQVSYHQVDIVTVNLPSTLGWKRASQTLTYYTHGSYCGGDYPNNCQKLAEGIVAVLDTAVDFSQYDNDHNGVMEPIMIIHAGAGAEFTGGTNDIWSHSWSLHSPFYADGIKVSNYVIMPEYWQTASAAGSDMTIGVFAHEMGHGFWGLPDLYDRDNSGSEGIGKWSLMASGSWNGPSGLGESPAWPDAWSRIRMGFVIPITVIKNTTGLSIPQVYGNGSTPTVYKITNGSLNSNEYFLIENRWKVAGSYDNYLPGSGLLIWHVDEAMYPIQNDDECTYLYDASCDPKDHYLVKLEQADAAQNLEHGNNRGDPGDPYPGSVNNRNFNSLSTPQSGSYYNLSGTKIGIEAISDAGAVMTANITGLGAYSYLVSLPLVLDSYSSGSQVINQGFEEMVVPPSNWTTIQTNPYKTWEADYNARSGINSAGVYYDDSVPPGQQNEVLLTPYFQAGSGMLEFYSLGSLYWCRETYNNCDLKIWLVKGNWDGGGNDDVLLRIADQDWPASYTWGKTSIDLTPYLTPGPPVRIAFQYYGKDGAQINVDDISLQYTP